MIAKTNAQRQADLKEKRQADGLVLVTNLWAYPEDKPAIREYAKKLTTRALARRKTKEKEA